jgi:hypothetical protein
MAEMLDTGKAVLRILIHLNPNSVPGIFQNQDPDQEVVDQDQRVLYKKKIL